VIKKIGIILIILLGLFVFLLSPVGLHVVIRVTGWFLPGQLTYQSLHGELGKAIDFKNLEYRSDSIELRISQLHLTWHPWSLFHKEIYIKNFQVKNISLKINKPRNIKKTQQAASTKQTPVFSPMAIPFSIRIDHANISDFKFKDYFLRRKIDIKQCNIHGLMNADNSNLQILIDFTKPQKHVFTASLKGPINNYVLKANYKALNHAWTLNGKGDETKIQIDLSGISHAQKILDGRLSFSWSPMFKWEGNIRANALPLNWLSFLPLRQVSFYLKTQGQYDADNKTQKTNISNLALVLLNGEAIKGDLYLEQKNSDVIFRSHLKDSEKDYLNLEAFVDGILNIKWSMQINDLSDFWLPIGGALNSQGYIKGSISNPTIEGTFNCNTLSMGNFILDQLQLKIVGTLPKHEIEINGLLNDTRFLSKIAGKLQTGSGGFNWSGNINQLDILTTATGHWKLTKPAYLYISPDQIEIHRGDLRSPDGKLTADMSWLEAKKLLKGSLNLFILKLPLPTLGVNFSQLKLNTRANGQSMNFNFGFISNKAPLTLEGKANWKDHLALKATLKGDNVETLHTTQYLVYLSPNLTLTVDKNRRIDLNGKILVPQMKISPRNITSVVLMPEDISFVGEMPKRPSIWQFYSKIHLMLGEKVFLNTYGLQGKLNGALDLLKEPDKVVTATGKLYLTDGTYNLFQQPLKVIRGNLNFINSSLANPNLEVQAVRQFTSSFTRTGFGLQRFEAGAVITGTLQHPKITLFSQPVTLSQTDILSYLLFGHGAGQGGTGATTMLLLQAVNSLKLGQSNSEGFIQKIQKKLGFTELGIESQVDVDALGNTLSQQNAFVVGRYLTPKIYLRYSRDTMNRANVFEARYLLSRHWMLQTNASTQGNGADILYTIEGGE